MSIIQLLPHDVRRALFAIVRRSEFSRMQDMRKNSRGEYSFKPFDDTKTIFVHIPKAAGVSVCKSLYGNLAGEHSSINYYQYVFSKNDFSRYFKFTFVRNPWDRLYSAYTFLKKGGFNKQDEKWAIENLSRFTSFEQFVMEWVVAENIHKYIHFVPQTELLIFPGTNTVAVDFVGFFENLENDFDYVAKKINKNISLPHLNKTDNKLLGYVQKYNSIMIDVVEKVYKADIDTFGYSFDNSTLVQQLARRSRE
ncbi:MAG: sulfotransferase family protein [Gammaproteobacteria bacterium]|nr:sulfotransferase family protein [Gammaproteobacteria bacterium]